MNTNLDLQTYEFTQFGSNGERLSDAILYRGDCCKIFLTCAWDEALYGTNQPKFNIEFLDAAGNVLGYYQKTKSTYANFAGNGVATEVNTCYLSGESSSSDLPYIQKKAVLEQIKIVLFWDGTGTMPDPEFTSLHVESHYQWELVNNRLTLNGVKEMPDIYHGEPCSWVWRVSPYKNEGLPYTDAMFNITSVDRKVTYPYIDFMQEVRVFSRPHGLDKRFPVTKMSIPLDNPGNATIELGATESKSFTAVTNKVNDELMAKLQEVPKVSTILQQAQNNASALIKNATNGYVTLKQNKEGGVEEIIISDEPDYTVAKNVWRWNRNGLGFSATGYEGEFNNAFTADGSIVADRITAGTMVGDRIRGGTMTVGGPADLYGFPVNGILRVLDSNNPTVRQVKMENGRVSFINNEFESGHIIAGNTYEGTDKESLDINAADGLIFRARWVGVADDSELVWSLESQMQDIDVITKLNLNSDGTVNSYETKTLSFMRGFFLNTKT